MCGKEIKSQSIDAMLETILAYPANARLTIMAPLARGKKGEFQKELKKLLKEGYVRVRVDGEVRELAEEIILDKNKRHDIDVVIDRLIVKEGIRKRLRDSLETAAGLSDGLVRVALAGGGELLFSERYACPDCGVSITELAPRMFSFNSPYGACPDCGGLGTRMYFDEELVVPDAGLSVREGAIMPWSGRHSLHYFQTIDALAEHYKFDINTPFQKLPATIRRRPPPRLGGREDPLLRRSGREAVLLYPALRGGSEPARQALQGDDLAPRPHGPFAVHQPPGVPDLRGRPAEEGEPRGDELRGRTSTRSAGCRSVRASTF